MSTNQNQQNQVEEKNPLIIPNFREFADLYHDRIHAILYHIEDWESLDEQGKETTRKFTLITNLRDRGPKKVKDDVLIYGGATIQRKILDKWKAPNPKSEKELEESWKYLNEFEYKPGQNLKEFITYDLYQNFKQGIETIFSLNIGSLAPYFRRDSNPVQEHERNILKDAFTLEGDGADFFLSVPVISLGTFDGVVHIIFEKEQLDYFLDKEQYEKNTIINQTTEEHLGILTKIERLEKQLDRLDKRKKRAKISNEDVKKIEAQETVIEKKRNLLRQKTKPKYPVKKDILIRIIKLFAMEYDSLLLDWDLVDTNIQESSRIKLEQILKPDYYEKDNRNPILKEVKFPTYYRISKKYFEQRIEQNNIVPRRLIEQQRQTAIITILVDSYAHNISAHSLTALNWWFRERAIFTREIDQLRNSKKFIDQGEILINNFIKKTQKINSKNPLIKYGGTHLSTELHPLFKFLMEKGAFWSGITRKTNFGGRRSSWYEVLWNDFINSPLYLGTIANTEGVNKINLHVTVYDSDETSGKYQRTRIIKEEQGGKKLTGHFVTIDLWQDKIEVHEDLKEKYEELNSFSSFVQLGENFEILRNYLAKAKVFLSGGVVGKHAFFTMVENEIRNVKHFGKTTLEHIQKEGLDVHISLQALSVKGDKNPNAKKELYQIGIWLQHAESLLRGQNDEDLLLLRKSRGLVGDIMEIKGNEYKPRLGGNYQDKICAGMLFNNDFGKVQNRKEDRDKTFYPWLIIATASEDNLHEDFELTPQNTGLDKVKEDETLQLDEADIKAVYTHTRGYVKKYLYMWQGAEIYHVTENDNFAWENISRFRFVHIPPAFDKQYKATKQKGAVRILRGNISDNTIEAYKFWLNNWRKSNDDFAIDLWENRILTKEGKITTGTLTGSIICKDGELSYLNYENTRTKTSVLRKERKELYDKGVNIAIDMAHGGKEQDRNDVWAYRSHGIVIREIFNLKKSFTEVKEIEPINLYEFFETLITKICVFDNRVYDRLKDNKRTFYQEKLFLDVQKEEEDKWTALKASGFENFHFLIVHLSFIEDLYKKRYNESNITQFVEEEVLGGKKIEDLEQNFTLVITTGRGRMEWWSNLEKSEYSRFTTFRPIESILSSVENALQKNDDFDLKYNITKVLFGS